MINKKIIRVPNGIEYISQWSDYKIPRGEHCIVDKGVTGCGYTELALCNEDPIVLCSPRKLLLENKSEKHLKEKHYNILYLDSLTQDLMLEEVEKHLEYCKELELPPKFLVTYDSTGKIVDCLKKSSIFNEFIFIVDEFQSVFLDSYFKVGIEFDFVNNLQECTSVVYLSATPMLDKYLDKLKEFKDLVFYKLDWSDSGFVETISIGRKRTYSLTQECCKIVNDYLKGKFPLMSDKDNNIIESREAVFYFNSIQEILRVIRKCDLKPSNTLIICSKTENNLRRLKKEKFTFGKIPLENEPRPMFTFCTSSVYMGVDFYSDCASSYVFADPNIECLALDISLDLPQIIGRQRKKSNPFKNYISLFYKTRRGDSTLTEETFRNYELMKKENTFALLNIFEKVKDLEREVYLKKLERDIKISNYASDFISISEKTGKPVYNKLIEIADERAWDVTRKDYQDTISVTKTLSEINNLGVRVVNHSDHDDFILEDFLQNQFFAAPYFHERMKLYCDFRSKYQENPVIIDGLLHNITDYRYHQYYNYYGPSGCSSRKYVDSELRKGWEDRTKEDMVVSEIYNKFKEGDRVVMSEAKLFLGKLYKDLSISKSPKATDLGEYFGLSRTNITTPDGVKKGFKLGKRLK